MDQFYHNSVLLQLPEERFKLQVKTPSSCNMVIEPTRLVFSSDPQKPYTGPFLQNGQDYIIEKEKVVKLENFNKMWNSAATLHFLDQTGQKKVVRIIFSGNLGGNIYETEMIYKNLSSWLNGGQIKNVHYPYWVAIVSIVLIVLGSRLAGILGIILAFAVTGLIYAIIRHSQNKK